MTPTEKAVDLVRMGVCVAVAARACGTYAHVVLWEVRRAYFRKLNWEEGRSPPFSVFEIGGGKFMLVKRAPIDRKPS